MSASFDLARYRGRRVALLTQHGKEALLAPVLEPALGCHVQRVEGFNTDTLGTFTRDIPREGTQVEAARRKASLAIELSGAAFGLGSEGAFGPDPYTGFLPWNVEVLVLVDALHHIELVASAQAPAAGSHALVEDVGALRAFAAQSGFPAQRLVLRPAHEDHPTIWKGLGSDSDLLAAFDAAQALADNRKVFVELELRAHFNPARQAVIKAAGEDLLRKLKAACASCGRPGFALADVRRGLPCADCGLPTREAVAEILACAGCGAREERPVRMANADPARCDHCNP